MKSELLGIGAAAKRFGLLPSTLRYWEERGLLRPSVRRGKWRFYGPEELHRIALIQIWQDTGRMSLEQIESVLAGTTRDRSWRTAVEERIRQVERQQAQLAQARRYLRYLLTCPDENPTEHCPYLRRATHEVVERGAARPSRRTPRPSSL